MRWVRASDTCYRMLPLFLIVFIDLVGFGIMMPLLPYYAKAYGAAPAEVSLLFGTYSVGQFIAAPLWGRLSDRVGRKPVLMISLFGSVICYAVLGLAPSLLVLYVARFIAGLMAGNIAAAFAYVSDITTPQNRSKGMGVIGAAFGLGFIFGPVIGGVFSGSDMAHADFRTPAFIAACLSAVALVAVIVVLKESLSRAQRLEVQPRIGRWQALRQAVNDTDLRRLIITMFLITTAMAILETSFTIWVNGTLGWGPRQVGYTFAFIGVLLAVVQGGGIGKLTRRFGEIPILITGALMLLTGFLGIPLSFGLPMLLCAVAVHAIGYALSQPTMNSLISQSAPPGQTGLIMGVSQSIGSVSRIVGPLLSGLMFNYFGLNAPYYLGAGLMLPVLAMIGRVRAKRTTRTAAVSEP